MKKSNFTPTDVSQHQTHNFGAIRCTCGAQAAKEAFENMSGLERHEPHADTCPMSLFRPDTVPRKVIEDAKKALTPSRRRLKKHREPNAIETEFGHKLQRDKQAGEIEDYIFEGVTLRWGDMEYTADYFVIRTIALNETEKEGGPFIQAVYVEIKGGHKFEDSIIKFKAFRARMKWATFEMWGKENGRWVRLA
jgi:hypothetical protein